MNTPCTVCGTSNPSGTAYCDGCGVELSAPSAAPGGPLDLSFPVPAAPAPSMPSVPAPAATVVATAGPNLTKAPDPAPFAAPFPAPETPTAARLGVKRFGALSGDAIPLGGPRLVLGRFDASTGPVDIDVTGLQGAEHISRRHAELYFERGAWWVRDLGSTNGVYVKRPGDAQFSPRVEVPTRLGHGDELAFGNLMLTFQEGPA